MVLPKASGMLLCSEVGGQGVEWSGKLLWVLHSRCFVFCNFISQIFLFQLPYRQLPLSAPSTASLCRINALMHKEGTSGTFFIILGGDRELLP